ncbi:MAG: hypothetical protein SH819_00440 [Cytophagales bacterium]|nr:hypothetical protein [Cytophagales bacterium]
MMNYFSISFHPLRFGLCGMLFLGISMLCRGQEQWEKEGEGAIKDVEIEIVKERQITLPRANRNFDKIPPRPFEPISPAITYEFRNLTFRTPNYNPTLRPLRLKQEELSRMYGNYLSAGIGNYTSFMVEGAATTKRDKNKLLGAEVYWRSFGKGPVGEGNSASSATRLKVFGKYMGTTVTTEGDISYQNDRAYFYGYAPGTEIDREKIRQVYERIGIQASLSNTRKTDFDYKATGRFSSLKDAYVSTEEEGSFIFNGSYKVKNGGSFVLVADMYLMQRKDSLFSDSRTLFRVKPAYQWKITDKLELTAGLHVAIRNDAIPGAANLNVYPNLKARYAVSDRVALFGSLTGDMDRVSLHTLSAENVWLAPNNFLSHTNRSLDFLGGIEGKLGTRLTAKAGASFASLKNLYFYQNERTGLDPAGNTVGIAFDKFRVTYDNVTQRINPFGEVSYTYADVLGITFRGDYFKYTTDVITDPWHRPTYRVDARIRYNIFEKIIVQIGGVAQGGMKAQDPASGLAVNLDQAVDLNFRARYFFSKQISAFVQLDNLLSNQYPLYLRYPARGFQGLIGASWSF